jgi:hypothetical protein
MYHIDNPKLKITQGDIFCNFEYVRWAEPVGGDLEVDSIEMLFFVVLTQSCDLDQDFNNRSEKKENQDKFIQSILVCPAYLAELVKAGTHLKEQNLIMENYNSKLWGDIKRNNNSRYHFLEKDNKLQLPELVIDFKQYYTIPTRILYSLNKKNYIGSLKPLFRECLSHRFAFYLSRIGLPDLIP